MLYGIRIAFNNARARDTNPQAIPSIVLPVRLRGIIELIPDNIPVIGNLDEGGASMLLLMSLRYFGLDPGKLFEKETNKKKVIEI
ncbi:MAG: DUF1232 domain-containing protein [Deltaproteobacteria bacterium]|nr:DUF1232 domain-containing protein [Deltaproteobacteria bacterium]